MSSRQRATWCVGKRELIAIAAGALLYGGLSYLTNIFHLQTTTDLQIRPGIGVPIVFGFVFGPVVGFFTGAIGNFLADLASGFLPYYAVEPIGRPVFDFLRSYLINWQIGNGLMGFIPGLLALYRRRYVTLLDYVRALLVAAAGIIAGMAFASFTHPYVDLNVGFPSALRNYFLDVTPVNLVNAAVIVPILLFNVEHLDLRSTDWLHSGLMRRLSTVILISAALPVFLLGLFLTQQTTGATVSATELTVKLIFTILLTLVFTVTNGAMVAQSISRPLLRLTRAAREMEEGTLSSVEAADLRDNEGNDEISRLSQVFGRMAQEVIQREEKLRQQVQQLKIEIDEAKKTQHVQEIVESEYFKELRIEARRMRERAKREDEEE